MPEMTRRTALRTGLASAGAAAVLAGCTVTVEEKFEADTFDDEWETAELATDRLHLSAGGSVVWEADATHSLDDVQVTLRPV